MQKFRNKKQYTILGIFPKVFRCLLIPCALEKFDDEFVSPYAGQKSMEHYLYIPMEYLIDFNKIDDEFKEIEEIDKFLDNSIPVNLRTQNKGLSLNLPTFSPK